MRFVRHELEVAAFGINSFELPPNGEGSEHDETSIGQEEVSFVVRGGGHWRVDSEQVAVKEGSFIRFDPEATRCPVAGADGTTMVSIGCPPGCYTPRGPF